MKKLLTLLGLVFVLGSIYYFTVGTSSNGTRMSDSDSPNTPQGALPTIIPVQHASAVVDFDGTRIVLDPTGSSDAYTSGGVPAVVLVTDIHGDHFSTSTLATVVQSAPLIVPQAVADMLPDDLKARAIVLNNGESTTEADLIIRAIPMYNLPESADSRHTKGRGNGYVIEKNGVTLYVAGDTAGTPEMRSLTNIDVALIPMNPPFTMTVDEAADAVLAFKPKRVYPYHYRSPNGLNDVEKFKQLVTEDDPSIEVVLENWYPSAQ